MKKIISLVFCLFAMVGLVVAKADKFPSYEITGAGSGKDGMVLVKVFVYGKKVGDQDLKRCAVHGVVFRGCTGNNSGTSQPALASPTAEADNAEFCEVFFSEDGACQGYATIVPGSYERVKTPKGYKQGAIIQVNKKALRKDLEKSGLVRPLSFGF